MEGQEAWEAEWEALQRYVGKCFKRSDTREVARMYLRGLLSPAERKNGWQLAEVTGQATPYKLQPFLYRGRWEADEVRDQLQHYVQTHLGRGGRNWVCDRRQW